MNSVTFDVVTECEDTLLTGLGLKNSFRFSEYEPGTCLVHALVSYSSCFSSYFIHAQSPFDGSFLESLRIWVSLILRSGLVDSKCKSQFLSFESICVGETVMSHTLWSLAFDGMWLTINTESSTHLQVLRICIHLALWILDIRERAINTWISTLATSFLKVCTRQSVRFSWLSLSHFRHRYLFHHLANFGVVNHLEKVNEVAPSLCLSCSGHAWMRILLQMNIALFCGPSDAVSLSEQFLACCLPFPFASLQSVLVSIAPFEMKTLGFLLEMSLDHEPRSEIIILLVTKCRFLSVDLQQQHAVGRPVSDCW